jgi:hypothetical protein
MPTFCTQITRLNAELAKLKEDNETLRKTTEMFASSQKKKRDKKDKDKDKVLMVSKIPNKTQAIDGLGIS